MSPRIQNAISQSHGWLPVRSFTTDDFAPHERHEAWCNQAWPAIAGSLDATADIGFHARSESLELGPLRITFGSFSGQHVARSPSRIRGDGIDHLAICMTLSAQLRTPLSLVSPGAVQLWDMGREWEQQTTTGDLITFTVPRDLALANGFDPQVLHGKTIAAEYAGLLRSHLHQVRATAPMLAQADGPRLARSIIDVVAVSLAMAGRLAEPTSQSTTAAIKLSAHDLIARELENPLLGVPFLCRELNVSRATVYRLFAEVGGVQSYIRRSRLLAARLALQNSSVQIAMVAERFSLGEHAYFSRIFRAEFGMTPSEYRAAFRQGMGAATR
jgi:AraC-like DNA-binding protein